MVDSEAYFTRLVYYIHANPQTHGFINDFKEWPWSSYNRILPDKPSNLRKLEVINWFGDKQRFLDFHARTHAVQLGKRVLLDCDEV